MLVDITGPSVDTKAAFGREDSGGWALYVEKCCRRLESSAKNYFM